MNRFLPVLILLCIGQSLTAQYVYTIKADSVKITNTCDTAELILENHTQTVPGFLFNKGRGRTEFRRGAIKLNDSMYIIGDDTMAIKPVSANNGLSNIPNIIQLGQNVGQAGSPAALLGDREIPLAGHNLLFSGGGSVSLSDNADTNKLIISKSGNTASIKYNSSGYSPSLTFVRDGGWVLGGNGQTATLSYNSILSLYPRTNGQGGYDPIINIQPYSANYMFRTIGAQNLHPAGGTAISFQNDVGRYLQLYLSGSTASDVNGGPNTVALWSSTTRGIRFIAYGSDSTAGIYFGTQGGYEANIKGFVNHVGNWILENGPSTAIVDNGAKLQVVGNETVSGNVGIGGVTSITAKMHLGAGTATAGTAPLKLTAGTVLSTPEDGAIEYDGTNYYVTQSTTRYTLTKTLSGQITTNFGGPSLSAFNSVTTTLSVPGAAAGDVVNVSANTGAVNPSFIIITAYITSANTVTLQAYNASNSAVTIASDTYKVRVIK